jgi:hypothetical protein
VLTREPTSHFTPNSVPSLLAYRLKHLNKPRPFFVLILVTVLLSFPCCSFSCYLLTYCSGACLCHSLAVIRDLLLSSLFNVLFLCTNIREPISRRPKTAESPVPFYSPLQNLKSQLYLQADTPFVPTSDPPDLSLANSCGLLNLWATTSGPINLSGLTLSGPFQRAVYQASSSYQRIFHDSYLGSLRAV